MTEKTPLAPLRDALENYLRDLSAQEHPIRTAAHAALKTASAGITGSVGRISRGLSEIVGSAPDESRGPQSQERLLVSIAQFFAKLATLHQRLVLYVDDVQWLDQVSWGILNQLQESMATHPILLICTARNDALSEEGLSKVRSWAQGTKRHIQLQPLSYDSLAQIVTAQLGQKSLSREVVESLAAKTNGNPFAMSQYVYAMLDAGVLTPQDSGWHVDRERLDQLIVSSDIIHLITSRIHKVSEGTRQVLRVAAIIGGKFKTDVVQTVIQTSPEKIAQALDEAVRSSLLEKVGATHFAFVHDRVLEALIQDQSPEQVVKLHQQVAEAMDNPRGEYDLYALATQYYKGEVAKNPQRVYEVCFLAGRQSAENYANDNAIEFLEQALSAQGQTSKPSPKHGADELFETLATVYLRNGILTKAAENCDKALTLAETALAEARLHSLRTLIYQSQNQGQLGWLESQKGLKALGTHLPENRILAKIWNGLHWTRYWLLSKFKIYYGAARAEEMSFQRVIMALYAPSCFVSFIGLRWEVTLQLLPRMLYHLHRIGDRFEAVEGLGFYALYLGFRGYAKAFRRISKLALQLAEASGDNQLIGLTRAYIGLGMHWCGFPKEAEAFQKEILFSFSKWIFPRWYISIVNDLAGSNLLIRGYAREAMAVAELGRRKADSTKSVSAIAVSQAVSLGPYATLGQDKEVSACLGNLDEIYKQIPKGQLDWCWHLAHRVHLHVERNEPVPDLDGVIENYLKMGIPARTAPPFYKAMYLHLAHATLRAYAQSTESEFAVAKLRFEKSLKNLHAATSMPHWQCHYWNLKASGLILEGRIAKAESCLRKAEKLADLSDCPWGTYLAKVSRARIAKRAGKLDEATEFAVAAESLAAEHGWTHREAHVRQEFQFEFALRKKRHVGPAQISPGARNESIVQRQLDALFAMIQSSAQSFELEDLVERTLGELLKIFAADRAFLFLASKGDLTLKPFLGKDSGGNRIDEFKGYSHTVIEMVQKERRSLTITGTAEGVLIGSQSAFVNDLRSIIAAPLVFRQKFLGIIYLDSRLTNGLFDDEDVKVIEAICTHIAVSVETSRNNSQLKALLELSLASSTLLDPEAQARVALDHVIDLMGAQRAFLFLGNEGGGELKMSLGRSDQKADLLAVNGYSSTVVKSVAQTQVPTLLTGTSEGELLGSKSAVAHDLRSIMAAPLKVNQTFFGVLYLDSQIQKSNFSPDDVRVLMGIASHIALALNTSRMAKSELERQALQRDLEVTGSVQALLLPRSSSIDEAKFQLVAHYEPADKSGGDWWWHHTLANGNRLVFLGDVTGHGVGAAMVTAIVAGICRTLASSLATKTMQIPALIELLNSHFYEICQDAYWMTMVVLEINPVTREVFWWSAAAPPVVHIRADGTIEFIGCSGLPLGSKSFGVGAKSLRLEPGATLFLPTDGIEEMKIPNEKRLGTRRLEKLLRQSLAPNIHETAAQIVSRLALAREEIRLEDDVTFLLIQFPTLD